MPASEGRMQRRCDSLEAACRAAQGVALRLALFGCLIPMLGGQPALACLHLALADHAHSYCAEHSQFEDVFGSPSRSATREVVTSAAGARPSVDAQDYRPAGAHHPCAVLNASTGSTLFAPPNAFSHPCCLPGLIAPSRGPADAADSVGCVFSQAPKRSPPGGDQVSAAA